jgi:hypothetical protein
MPNEYLKLIESLSAVFAIIAALLWLQSARVRTPTQFPINTITPIGGIGTGGSPALQELGQALRRQSRWSAAAAICAAVSALLQAIATLAA